MQSTVSRSSTESKYKVVANATTEIIWVEVLLQELGVKQDSSFVIWCDNIGTTYYPPNQCFMLIQNISRLIIILFVKGTKG
jgi:hypothetical protein